MDNPFKKILNSASGLFASNSSDSAVGIDIGSSAIKIVEIKKKKGKAVLETYGSISLGSYGEVDLGRVTNLPIEKIVEALKEVLKQSGVVTTSAALSIPVQSSLIFTIELPAQIKESEISSIVSTEARKYIPVPITEVTLDYFLLPQKEPTFEEANNPDASLVQAEKNEVLVVAIQNDAVAKYRTIVSQAQLAAGFFEIEIFSSIRANLEHELSLVLLMDFGASHTKLSLVEFGMVKGFHTINRGSADISDSISKSLSIPFAKAEQFKKDFGFKDQIQRSAISIPSNIAEGDELGTDKQAIRYFYISKGSTAELMTQLIIANEIGYIDDITKDSLVDECNKISAMLSKLIKARSNNP